MKISDDDGKNVVYWLAYIALFLLVFSVVFYFFLPIFSFKPVNANDAFVRVTSDIRRQEVKEVEIRPFSYSHYLQVQPGWTVSQINQLTGYAVVGRGISSINDGHGRIYESYSWQNPDGSNMIGSFVNFELTSKAQAGLR